MARFIQLFNRVIRCPLNHHVRPTQSTVCDEDRQKLIVCQPHGNPPHRAHHCHIHNVHSKEYHNERRQRSKNGRKEEETADRCEWNENFTYCLRQYILHHVLKIDTIAWGAVLLFGLHFPRIWTTTKREREFGNRQPYYRICFTPSKTLSNVIPQGYSSAQPINTPELHDEDQHADILKKDEVAAMFWMPHSVSKAWEKFSENEVSSHDENLENNPKSDFIAESKPSCYESSKPGEARSTVAQALALAAAEWKQLCEQDLYATKKKAAIRFMQEGRKKEAMALWADLAQVNDKTALYNLALCYHTGGGGVNPNINKAVEYYHRAADLGHSKSLYNLGILYLEGQGGLKQDRDAALACFKKASDQGFALAQRELALLYLCHSEAEKAIAVELLTSAAQKNDTDSLYYLGLCCENGIGMTKSDEKALDYYKHAANHGHISAMYNLAIFYEDGFAGLEADDDKALELYNAAACGGHEEAKVAYNRLCKAMIDDSDTYEEEKSFDSSTSSSTHGNKSTSAIPIDISKAFAEYINTFMSTAATGASKEQVTLSMVDQLSTDYDSLVNSDDCSNISKSATTQAIRMY